MQTIADDPECATQDEFELAGVRRAFQRHTGPVRDSAGELIGRIIVIREITAEREAARAQVASSSRPSRTSCARRSRASSDSSSCCCTTTSTRPTSERYLKTIHSEAQRLTGLVDDFLDVQKIEAGRFTLALESFELGELAEHQVELFATQSASHRSSSPPRTSRSRWSETAIASARSSPTCSPTRSSTRRAAGR